MTESIATSPELSTTSRRNVSATISVNAFSVEKIVELLFEFLASEGLNDVYFGIIKG